MGALFNDRSHVDALVPPSGLSDRLVRASLRVASASNLEFKSPTYVTSNGSHHSQVVFVDDLLHLLHAAEIAEHVADGNNVARLDQAVGNLLGDLDIARRDGLGSSAGPSHV
jgi:hypothetical protein